MDGGNGQSDIQSQTIMENDNLREKNSKIWYHICWQGYLNTKYPTRITIVYQFLWTSYFNGAYSVKTKPGKLNSFWKLSVSSFRIQKWKFWIAATKKLRRLKVSAYIRPASGNSGIIFFRVGVAAGRISKTPHGALLPTDGDILLRYFSGLGGFTVAIWVFGERFEWRPFIF